MPGEGEAYCRKLRGFDAGCIYRYTSCVPDGATLISLRLYESLSICAITYGKHHFRPIAESRLIRGIGRKEKGVNDEERKRRNKFFSNAEAIVSKSVFGNYFFVLYRVCSACYFIRRLTSWRNLSYRVIHLDNFSSL